MSPTSNASRRLRPTFEQAGSRVWRKPGGPWDVAALGSLVPTGGHLAVVDGGLRIDATTFERLVSDLADRMLASGIRRHQVVAWQLPNGASALLLYWACWRIGAVAA